MSKFIHLTTYPPIIRIPVAGTISAAAYVYFSAKSTKALPALMNLAEVIVIGTCE